MFLTQDWRGIFYEHKKTQLEDTTKMDKTPPKWMIQALLRNIVRFRACVCVCDRVCICDRNRVVIDTIIN